jgi:hypothetical protein
MFEYREYLDEILRLLGLLSQEEVKIMQMIWKGQEMEYYRSETEDVVVRVGRLVQSRRLSFNIMDKVKEYIFVVCPKIGPRPTGMCFRINDSEFFSIRHCREEYFTFIGLTQSRTIKIPELTKYFE